MARILIIDDDPQIRHILRRILNQAGYEVVEAENGIQGLRQYREAQPDLVISDIFMPEKDGLELIDALRSAEATVPIIAISGGSQLGKMDLLSVAAHLGAQRIVRKPFRRDEVLAVVREFAPPTIL